MCIKVKGRNKGVTLTSLISRISSFLYLFHLISSILDKKGGVRNPDPTHECIRPTALII